MPLGPQQYHLIGSDIGGRQHFAAWNSHLHTKEVLFLSFAPASFSRKDQNDALQGVVGPDSCLIQLPPLDHFIMGQLDAIYLTRPWNPTPLMEPVSTSQSQCDPRELLPACFKPTT
ncbi:SNHG14 isoform 15 [Pan troglodytes]|uniref:SNHG14 isoform 15 n=1 Tax=Pan troglodytes TaxID=9598 RepID=A0A2J8KLG4_PANTR|nr:SNHG14 isoform 15 [Pan troglodytes]